MQLTASVCPTHSNGGTGHDNNPPLCTLMPLVKLVLKAIDKGDCDGRKGRADI